MRERVGQWRRRREWAGGLAGHQQGPAPPAVLWLSGFVFSKPTEASGAPGSLTLPLVAVVGDCELHRTTQSYLPSWLCSMSAGERPWPLCTQAAQMWGKKE